MLPSRGLARVCGPCGQHNVLRSSAGLRQGLSSRSFSSSRTSTTRGPTISRIGLQSRGLSSTLSTQRVGGFVAAGAASSAFSRTGTSRSLSLWPFWSSGAPADANASKPAAAAAAAETPAPAPTTPQTAPTTPAPVVDAAPVASTSSSTSTPVSDPLSSTFSSSSSYPSLETDSILNMPETIGYLKALGLDFGWGPTAFAEWCLESVHVYAGLPWWGSIAAVAIIWRVILFKPTLEGTKASEKLNRIRKSPEFILANQEMQLAAARGAPYHEIMQARQKVSRITKSAGVSFFKPLIPPLFLAAGGFGMFRLLRAMANLPVPSMENGGLAWFTDLTVHDPLYVLPMISAGLLVFSMKQMQKSTGQSAATGKAMMLVLTPLMLLATLWLPAGVQFFFLISSIGALGQSGITLNPAFRRWAGLTPLPGSGPDAPPLNSVGAATANWQAPTPVNDGVKGGLLSNIKKNLAEATTPVKDELDKRSVKNAYKKAQEYEKKRQLEDKEKMYARMEEQRRRMSDRR